MTNSSTPRYSRAPAVVAWVVILGLVGNITYRNADTAGMKDYQRLIADEQSKMFGMLAVQLKSLETSSGAALRPDKAKDQLIRQMGQGARTSEDKLRLAILAGELLGREPALARLESLAQTDVSTELTADIAAAQAIYQNGPDALSPEAAERLIRRHGYLGQIALAYGVAADKEPRKSIQASALRFTVRTGLLALGLILLALISLGLFVAACVFAAMGKIRLAYVPDPSLKAELLEGFALYLILFLILGLVLRRFGAVSLQWQWLALLIIPVVVVWSNWRGLTNEQQRQALGWHCGRGWSQEMGAGIAGYLAGLLVIALGCTVTFFLIRLTGASVGSPVIQMLKGDAWHTAGMYGVLCIFAPVMEETMFRGALFHHLRRRWRWVIGAPTVSLIFALMHPQGWVAVPALGAVAIVLAALREWRGSIIAPMAAHACNNFIVATIALVILE